MPAQLCQTRANVSRIDQYKLVISIFLLIFPGLVDRITIIEFRSVPIKRGFLATPVNKLRFHVRTGYWLFKGRGGWRVDFCVRHNRFRL
jgi:hypothetical protein